MRFEKTVLGEIPKCYATLGVELEGEPCLFFAGEGPGCLQVFRGADFSRRETIWEGGGGTMSIVAVPERPGWLMVSRGFYSMVESTESSINLVRYRDGVFSYEPIAYLPYLHRFGLLRGADGTLHLLAASIADHKESKEDWSHPGHLYTARLPDDLEASFTVELTRLSGDYTANHGYCAAVEQGQELAYIGAREGVFRVCPPQTDGAAWTVEQIMDRSVSDMALCDLDGDGRLEMATIEPFHGEQFKVYRNENGVWSELYAYPVEQGFYHVVVAAELCGERVFVGGARTGAQQLFLLRWNRASGAVEPLVIDEAVGPSNVAVLNRPDGDLLLSANRMIFEPTVYRFAAGDGV